MTGMPKVFRIFGGCGTRPFCPSKRDSNILAVRHIEWRMPENAQAALAKISIRVKTASFILFITGEGSNVY